MTDENHRSHDLVALLCNPAAFTSPVEALDEVCDNAGNERLVFLVPAVLLGIQDCLARHDETHVTGLRVAEDDRRGWPCGKSHDGFDCVHGVDDAPLLEIAVTLQQCD